ILHNAEQLDDGSWVWRHQRHRLTSEPEPAPEGALPPLDFDDLWNAVAQMQGPLCLARGMRSQSVVSDADEAEFVRRNPAATVVHFEESGHSLQGDEPVALARLIDDLMP
ncbi:MAG: hypothetical protein PHU75_09860, partial [Candidatus Nanopelagicales bacterium]|nr:hypothetical protein [Candidatus Nanopelagicales bacterium]